MTEQKAPSSHTAKVKPAKKPAKKPANSAKIVAEYEAKIAELNDKVLRAAAEVQNTRKIAEGDIAKARNFAVEQFAKDMVAVAEHLIRACDAIETSEHKDHLEGVALTKKEMLNALERHYIKRIHPEGEPFDHNYHQAMSQAPSTEHPENTVLQVIQAGYTLKDRLLQPALVIVSKQG